MILKRCKSCWGEVDSNNICSCCKRKLTADDLQEITMESGSGFKFNGVEYQVLEPIDIKNALLKLIRKHTAPCDDYENTCKNINTTIFGYLGDLVKKGNLTAKDCKPVIINEVWMQMKLPEGLLVVSGDCEMTIHVAVNAWSKTLAKIIKQEVEKGNIEALNYITINSFFNILTKDGNDIGKIDYTDKVK